jgi:hypothetical protein
LLAKKQKKIQIQKKQQTKKKGSAAIIPYLFLGKKNRRWGQPVVAQRCNSDSLGNPSERGKRKKTKKGGGNGLFFGIPHDPLFHGVFQIRMVER